MSELLSCPFCGSDAAHIFPPTCRKETPYNAGDRAFPEARCPGCYASVGGKDWDHAGSSAAAAWNRRADPLVEKLRGALEPFAKAFDSYESLKPGPDIDHWPISEPLTLGDLRRAREALALPDGGGSSVAESAASVASDLTASDTLSQSEGEA